MRPLLAVSLIVMASSVAAAPAPPESWGKAGISLDQYRQDALDCGLQGHYTDISKTEDAKELVRASRQLDAMTTGTYAPNTTSYIVDRSEYEQTYAASWNGTTWTTGSLIAQSLFYYDGAASNTTAPTSGLLTRTDNLIAGSTYATSAENFFKSLTG